MNGQKIHVLRRSKTEIHTYEGGSLRTAGLHVNGYDSEGDETFEGIENHLEVYFKQISHINFVKTPISFRILITSNAEKLICYNLKNSPQRQIKWKNKFKNIGYDFRCE